MPKKFYLDTAVWRDYLEDREDSMKPLGELAFQFLQKCREHHCTIIIAEPVLFELKDIPKHLIDTLLSSFKDLLTEAPVSEKQLAEAKKISKERNLPFNDVFHAVISRDNKAIMITRDAHFEQLSDIVESMAPEEASF